MPDAPAPDAQTPDPQTVPPVPAIETPPPDERKQKEKEEKALLDEVKSGKHFFEVKHRKEKFCFTWPTVEDNQKADWHYSKTYMKAIQEGLPLEDELLRILKEKKLWTSDDQKHLEDMQVQYVLANAQYYQDTTKPEAKEKRDKLRDEVLELQRRRRKYLQNSVEEKAGEARNFFLISQIALIADSVSDKGQKVWPTYEGFLADKNKQWIYEVLFEYFSWINGLPESFFAE